MEMNCTPPAIDGFPWDGFSRHARQHGAVVLHLMAAGYLFCVMAVVCNKYFVPSIHRISKCLGISDSTTGATIMAAATSSPELFVSSVASFTNKTEADAALGTIVGSAVFNVLAVPACCGLFSKQLVMQLEVWSVTRESLMYAFSVVTLAIVLRDGKVWWYEALFFICLYFSYVTALCIGGKQNGCCNQQRPQRLYDDLDVSVTVEEIINVEEQGIITKEVNEMMTLKKGVGIRQIIMCPANIILSLTIPDCKKAQNEYLYPLTFLMSIVWFAITSYLATWMTTIVGDTLNIPDSLVGLTLLAVGTSLPEAISSIIVTREGRGAMGISNTIGSNTFDILLCLGLPWLLKAALFPVEDISHYINISSEGLLYSSISLVITLFLFYVAMIYCKFQLSPKFGILVFSMYILFLIFASLVELNIFFKANLPTCIR